MNSTMKETQYQDTRRVEAVRPGEVDSGATAARSDGLGVERAPTGVDADSSSIGGLLRQLGREIPSLLTKEVALLKAEARESVRATGQGVAAVSTGGAVMLAGLVVLLMAAVYALSTVLVPWAAALVVGVAALLVGYMMVKAGQKKFSADELRPDRSINTFNKDKDAIGGRMS